MTDDFVASLRGRGWSAVGGRVMPPADGMVRDAALVPPPARRELTGRVSFASADGMLGPGRRLRFRRTRLVRQLVAWMLVVLLMPVLTGWIWGLIGVFAGGR